MCSTKPEVGTSAWEVELHITVQQHSCLHRTDPDLVALSPLLARCCRRRHSPALALGLVLSICHPDAQPA